jgi:hypothetical protein
MPLRFQFLILPLILSLFSCEDFSFSKSLPESKKTHEAIYRRSEDQLLIIPPLKKKDSPSYPWNSSFTGGYPKIDKEFFRCKGSFLNPPDKVMLEEQWKKNYDCGGRRRHSLPVYEKEEFIYPILIELLNYIQSHTKKRVIIASGHRCEVHNMYSDPSVFNSTSKHMIGAEVDFYVEGAENEPMQIIDLIIRYYQKGLKYQGLKEYQEFSRYKKDDTNVVTSPWFNKEIFMKLFLENEGRDFDNRHPYPYVSIQVRYNPKVNARVHFNWKQAYQGYLKW